MKVAIYQGASPEGDVDLALKTVERSVATASQFGAQMVVFPELFLPGYNQPDLHTTMAQTKSGPWQTALSDIAKTHQCGITIGWAERDGDAVFNSASCFDDTGKKVAHYRKIQLFGRIEKATFAAGDTYQTFMLNGYRAAVLICYDVEFAHHVHALKERGVQLLLVPTANPKAFNNVPDFIVPARAAENDITIAYANYSGNEAGLTYGGLSLIAGPDGAALAKAGLGEVLLIADLDAVGSIDETLLSTQTTDKRVLIS
nr:carbon-nitrogen hydrolase family protein [uncultured Shimia sp.]